VSADRAPAPARTQGWHGGGGGPVNGGAGVDPLVALLLQRMDGQEERASEERQEQTTAMTAALDRLGGRFEARIAEQTASMLTAVKIASAIIVVALLLLGSIGGAVVVLDTPAGSATTNAGGPQ